VESFGLRKLEACGKSSKSVSTQYPCVTNRRTDWWTVAVGLFSRYLAPVQQCAEMPKDRKLPTISSCFVLCANNMGNDVIRVIDKISRVVTGFRRWNHLHIYSLMDDLSSSLSPTSGDCRPNSQQQCTFTRCVIFTCLTLCLRGY